MLIGHHSRERLSRTPIVLLTVQSSVWVNIEERDKPSNNAKADNGTREAGLEGKGV